MEEYGWVGCIGLWIVVFFFLKWINRSTSFSNMPPTRNRRRITNLTSEILTNNINEQTKRIEDISTNVRLGTKNPFKVGDKVMVRPEIQTKFLAYRKNKTVTGTVRRLYHDRMDVIMDGRKTPLPLTSYQDWVLIDSVKYNVVADWLEEKGCPKEWTDKLRKEFPLE